MKERKQNKKKYSLLILLLLAVISVGAVVTYARYISTFSGTGSATIAKWNIVLKKDGSSVSNTFTLDLATTKTANSNVVSTVVAPGDTGSFVLNLTDTGTQVAYSYTIAIDTSAFTPTTGNVQFFSDSAMTTPWSNVAATTVSLGQAGSQDITKTIYWKWVAGETNNANDTTAGTAAATLQFPVTVTATQITS